MVLTMMTHAPSRAFLSVEPADTKSLGSMLHTFDTEFWDTPGIRVPLLDLGRFHASHLTSGGIVSYK